MFNGYIRGDNMKQYCVDVTRTKTVVERTVVTAENIEEAKQKIISGDVNDILDEYDVEEGKVTDFDFFEEDEV